MRIRATVGAVSGALALSALAVPAAQAAEPKAPANIAAASEAAHSTVGRSTFAAAAVGTPYDLNATFSAVKVNNAKNIVVGTTKVVKVPVSFTLTHGADVNIQAADFFAGSSCTGARRSTTRSGGSTATTRSAPTPRPPWPSAPPPSRSTRWCS